MDDVRAVLDGSKRWCVVRGDSAEVLPSMPASSFDAVVTDPPAGIAFMDAEWDDFRRARNPADADRDSVGGRLSRSAPEVGRGDRERFVVWLAGILASARASTKPGGRAFVWSIPRTSHWTGFAVEDAGWTIETEVCHLFGQGFPKGKSQLKPAHEGWKLARNGPSTPLEIEACRVGASKRVPHSESTRNLADLDCGWGLKAKADVDGRNPNLGRWPATVEGSHTPWCQCVGTRRVSSPSRFDGGAPRTNAVFGDDLRERAPAGYADPDGLETVAAWQCVEGCPVLALDRESGELTSGKMQPHHVDRGKDTGSLGAFAGRTIGRDFGGDTGTASRFFAQHPAVDPDEPDPFVYATKVPAAERWCLARCGCGERVTLLDEARRTCVTDDGKALDTEDDVPAVRSLRCTVCGLVRVHTVHPTQKSVALMRRFVRLISRPGDVILDPFGGSFTTGVAALLEGRRFVGIERDPHFAAIGRARLDATVPSPERLARVATEPVRVVAPDYGPLFGGTR